MNVNEKDLRLILDEAFESGFHGVKDLQESVVEALVERMKKLDTATNKKYLSYSQNMYGTTTASYGDLRDAVLYTGMSPHTFTSGGVNASTSV